MREHLKLLHSELPLNYQVHMLAFLYRLKVSFLEKLHSALIVETPSGLVTLEKCKVLLGCAHFTVKYAAERSRSNPQATRAYRD